MDVIYLKLKASATYYVSRDRDGEVADWHVVSVPFKLNLHQPFKTPAEKGDFGDPSGHWRQ